MKDIAILADVSTSVKGDWRKHEEARGIITDLLAGKPMELSDWDVDTEGVDPDLLAIYGRFMGRSEGILPPAPLTAPGRRLKFLRAGRALTVEEKIVHRQVPQMDGLDEMIRTGYPALSDIRDNSTCFWFAMARAAELLRVASADGYYLFVVSDEEDDPDYLEKGPPGHNSEDYRNYVKYIEPTMPVSTIRARINQHFTQVKEFGKGAYVQKGEFPISLIAKFYQRGVRRDDRNKVCLAWYAMGARPTAAPQPAPLAIEKSKALEPPSFKPVIQWLGGLQPGRPKVFSYKYPVVAWQLPFGEANSLNTEDFEIVQMRNETDPDARLGTISYVRAATVSGTGDRGALRGGTTFNGAARSWLNLVSGRYFIQIRSRPKDGGEIVKSETATIVIKPREGNLLLALAAASLLVALGMFLWTWLHLRARTQDRMPRPRR